MKTLIIALLVVLCSTSYAQITVEHQFADSNEYFSVVQVDSGEYYYVLQSYGDSSEHKGVDIKLFDLEYNLIKEIDIPTAYLGNNCIITYITRRLFDLDDEIEYIVYDLREAFDPQQHSLRILNESGTELFSCDSCSLGFDLTTYIYEWQRGIYNTPKGAKMLIMKHYYRGKPLLPANIIYSLPGKLPGNTTSSVEDITYIQSALNIESFPNPASDRIQVNYKLPAGATSGFITIRDTKGAELQRHRINYIEESITLDTQTLSPGSYYCCLLTDDGRTAMKKMLVLR